MAARRRAVEPGRMAHHRRSPPRTRSAPSSGRRVGQGQGVDVDGSPRGTHAGRRTRPRSRSLATSRRGTIAFASSSRAPTRRCRWSRESRSPCARWAVSRRARSRARSSCPSRRWRSASCARSGRSGMRASPIACRRPRPCPLGSTGCSRCSTSSPTRATSPPRATACNGSIWPSRRSGSRDSSSICCPTPRNLVACSRSCSCSTPGRRRASTPTADSSR